MSARTKRLRQGRAGKSNRHSLGAGLDAGSAPGAASAVSARIAGELINAAGLDSAVADRVVRVVRQAFGGLEHELETKAHQLTEQRHFIEQVVDALPVGLHVVDREYRVQLWNHTREVGLQGIARGEVLGRTIFEVLHRQSAESLRREFDLVFATGELHQFEAESRAATVDGRGPRTFRISKIPLKLQGDEVTHVITVGEDVTSWKEAEARAAQAEKLAAIGQLAAGVMHEINNPLATIAACAESLTLQLEPLLRSDLAPPPPVAALPVPQFIEYLRVIDTEVRRCKGIAEALLNFSRVRPGERVPVDLNEVVEQTMFLLKHHRRFRQQAVQLELAPDSGGVIVHGNAEQLVQVFMALLHNAADAVGGGRDDESPEAAAPEAGVTRTPPARAGRARSAASPRLRRREATADASSARAAGQITIRTWRAGTHVVAEVSDRGPGIPRSLRSKIFEPFFTTKPVGRGTGLGLSVCYGIVADHGGRLEVESEVGIGSTFRIVLPSAGTDSTAATNGTRHVARAGA